MEIVQELKNLKLGDKVDLILTEDAYLQPTENHPAYYTKLEGSHNSSERAFTGFIYENNTFNLTLISGWDKTKNERPKELYRQMIMFNHNAIKSYNIRKN